MNPTKHPRRATPRGRFHALAAGVARALLAFSCAGALSAADVLDDRFADGERATQSLPGSAAWRGNNASALAVASEALVVSPSGNGLAYFTAAASPRVLAVGDSLVASFTLRLAGSAFPVSNDFFRVALLNSSGTASNRNAAGAAQRVSADGYNTATAAFANHGGYMATVAVNPASAAAIKLYSRNANATNGLTGTGSYTALGSTGGAGAHGFLAGNIYSGSLTVRRTASSTTELTLAFDGAFAGGSGSSWSRTHADSTTAAHVFDLLAFYISGGGSFASLTLDEVRVTHTPAAIAPAITSATSAAAGAGSPFTYQIVASNTPTSYAASGLPSGFTIDSDTGLIEGRPAAAGSHSVTVSASNAGGTGSATLALSVSAAPAAHGTIAAFKAALDAAVPGSVVILADGTYAGLGYYKMSKSGSAAQPIVIRAQTPGGVTFKRSMQIEIQANHVVLDGFRFSGADRQTPDYVYPPRKSGLIKIRGNDVRVTECTIDGVNRVDDAWDDSIEDKDKNMTKWIQMRGDRIRVDHCVFKNKVGKGQIIDLELDDTVDHHRIDHNRFENFAYSGYKKNEYETVRVGVGALSISTPSASIVENNYFDACDGETETISVKSSDCVIRDNTLVNCRGTITLRQGKRNLVTGNVLLNLVAKEESGGVRVCGSDHEIRDNYVYGARTAGSSHMGGIVITGSDVDPAADPSTYPYDMHWPVEDVLVQNNSLINCEQSFVHGGGYSYHPVSAAFIDNCARNNLSGNGAFEIVSVIRAITTPLYAGERYYGSSSGFSSVPGGVDTVNDPAVAAAVINGYTLYFASGGAGTDAAHVYPLQAADVGPLGYTP